MTCFEYTNRWAQIADALLSGNATAVAEAVRLLEMRDLELEAAFPCDSGFPHAWCGDGSADIADGDLANVVEIDTSSHTAEAFALDAAVCVTNNSGGPVTLNIFGYYAINGTALNGNGNHIIDNNTTIADGKTVTLPVKPCTAWAGDTVVLRLVNNSGATLTFDASLRAIEVAADDVCCIGGGE